MDIFKFVFRYIKFSCLILGVGAFAANLQTSKWLIGVGFLLVYELMNNYSSNLNNTSEVSDEQ